MSQLDPKGYYLILGVSPEATSAEIARAYKNRARDLHPDRNRDRDTTADFQALQEAYSVLGTPDRRAPYDTCAFYTTGTTGLDSTKRMAEPVRCSKCATISPSARYVLFWAVSSYLFGCTRTARQGIFCPDCSQRTAILATLQTWLLGWWSFKGFFLSIHAIFHNLFGGTKPVDSNFTITYNQSLYFIQSGRPDVGRTIASDALRYADRNTSNENHSSFLSAIQDLIALLDGANIHGTPIKKSWSWRSHGFLTQVLLCILALSGLALIPNSRPPSAPSDSLPEPLAHGALSTSTRNILNDSALFSEILSFIKVHIGPITRSDARQFLNRQPRQFSFWNSEVRGKFDVDVYGAPTNPSIAVISLHFAPHQRAERLFLINVLPNPDTFEPHAIQQLIRSSISSEHANPGSNLDPATEDPARLYFIGNQSLDTLRQLNIILREDRVRGNDIYTVMYALARPNTSSRPEHWINLQP